MVENLNLHEDCVEYCNELYASQHDSFQNFDFTSNPIADPLVVTVVRKSDVNVYDE